MPDSKTIPFPRRASARPIAWPSREEMIASIPALGAPATERDLPDDTGEWSFAVDADEMSADEAAARLFGPDGDEPGEVA